MAEIKSRETIVFLPFRGTNLQKTAKNAQIATNKLLKYLNRDQ